MMLLVVVFEDKLFVETSFPQNWGVLRAKLFGLLQKYPHAEEIGVFHVWLLVLVLVLVLGFLWIRSKQKCCGKFPFLAKLQQQNADS